MTSLQLRITCGLLLGLAWACGSAQPAEPPAAAVETELKASAVDAPAPAAPATPVPEPAAPSAAPAAPDQAAAAPTEAKPAAAPAALCDELCSRTASLKCGPVAACKTGCEEMAKSDICTAELNAMLACLAGKPASSFECDPDTKAPALRDGHCEAEHGAVAECIGGGGM